MNQWKYYAKEVVDIVEFLAGKQEVPDAVQSKAFLPAIRALKSNDSNEHQKCAKDDGAGRPTDSELRSSWICGEWVLAAPQQVIISPLCYDHGLFPHLICATDLVI